jgi:hypothetical protein
MLLAVVVITLAVFTSMTLPSAAVQELLVRMPDGTYEVVTEIPDGAELIGLAPEEGAPLPDLVGTGDASQPAPATPAPAPAPPAAATPAPARPATPAPVAQDTPPVTLEEERQKTSKSKRKIRRPKKSKPRPKHEGPNGGAEAPAKTPLRNTDGSPTRSNPGFVDALPGPSFTTGVPNFVIRKFRVPIFLLPIYQAAGIQYGIRWEVLAAINEIETDYGRNLNVSSAGALGWMQFMPSTWRQYGTDANKDGKKDPYNPVDAIFAAGRYLKAAGYEKDVRRSIFAYNHADWYVDSVMLRARLIAGVPADLVGSLTGLTEGRFPVAARARYADDLREKAATKRVKTGENAANVIEDKDGRRSVEIFAREGSPVVATNDGVVKKIGRSEKLGRYLILQDVYGNRYMYAGLGEVSQFYPVPKDNPSDAKTSLKVVSAKEKPDPKPSIPASRGSQPKKQAESDDVPADEPVAVKERLFANPSLEGARENGGYEQIMEAQSGDSLETYDGRFARPIRLDPKRFELRPLRKGAHVIGGTVLGRLGVTEENKGAHLDFSIRPAGKGAPRIDPKPILDGWKLLEATAIYRASGRNALRSGDGGDSYSIGQILMMPKQQLEKRVLGDERITIYEAGRDDIRSGQIDRRVLATLAYLAESGLRPTVSCLKSGHGYFTSSGNVSDHSSGNAADIAEINGVSILGHQEPGGVTDQSVRRLMRLQGTMRPSQIISLLDLGANTLAMGDHNDHIHVGFRPRFGANRKLSKQAQAVLKPGQWPKLLKRLGEIENPVVPLKPSKYALPVTKLKRTSALD